MDRVSTSTGLSGLAVLLAILLLSGCGDDSKSYVFYSGGEGGVYHPTAQVIAELVNEAGADHELSVRTSGGSIENARALGEAEADFALIQSDIAAYARAGELEFEEQIPEILGLAALYPEHIQIVTRAEADIASLADLAGKRVAVGDAGSGTEAGAFQIMEAAGLNESELAQVEHLDAGDSAAYLADGRIDAAFFTFGLGTPALQELAQQIPISFLPVDGDVRQSLLAEYEFYREGTIPAGSYPGIEQDIATVVVTAVLVARAAVPSEVVERTLHALFDNLSAFEGGRLEELRAESAREGLSLPLHPGAEAFYSALLE